MKTAFQWLSVTDADTTQQSNVLGASNSDSNKWNSEQKRGEEKRNIDDVVKTRAWTEMKCCLTCTHNISHMLFPKCWIALVFTIQLALSIAILMNDNYRRHKKSLTQTALFCFLSFYFPFILVRIAVFCVTFDFHSTLIVQTNAVPSRISLLWTIKILIKL